MEKVSTEEYRCPICYQVYVKPAKTPCNHRYCLDCLTQLLELADKHCPMCRAEIKSSFQPKVDTEFESIVMGKCGEEVKTRTEEAKNRENAFIRVRFEYGNKHEILPGDNHKWTVFIKAARSESDTLKYVY